MNVDDLYAVIESRKNSSSKTSYTASLFKGGSTLISKKLGEETIELIIEASKDAVKKDKNSAIFEAADVLYHYLVLLSHLDITPSDVLEQLKKRAGKSGIEEKASRKIN